ncbi:MAG TPA: Gfo/Idh/MocA family oxidoreductase [Phycisphaerae bacterium]|nr:Gfo/Idh/MocA family oxidoreductase [Phycisphaerae bacterium]
MSDPLRTAVIGVGHMGRHHARLYHDLPEAELVAVVDTDRQRAADIAKQYAAKPLTDMSDLLELRLDAVTIAVPTVAHEALAAPLIEAGVALLIEKPLAPDSASARRLLDLAQAHDCVIQVGHSERFNPVVRAMDRMGVKPKFIETHRISPFTFRSADIGVVFDMMIHDIDIVLHLVACRDYEVRACGVSILSKHEDIANARVEFADGCVANLTASRLALKTERKIRVFCPDAYLSMDYQKKTGIAIKKDANLDLLKLAGEKDLTDLAQVAGLDFGSMVKVEPLQVDDVEPLKAEIQSFLASVRDRTTPAVSAEDGFAAVHLAERIVRTVQQHDWDVSA